MKSFLKIVLLLLAVFPLWITILAFGNETPASLDLWKEKINSKLLLNTTKKIQVAEIVGFDRSMGPQDDEFIKSSFAYDIDLSQIRVQGISPILVKFYDEKGTLKRLFHFQTKLFVQEEVPLATHSLSQGKTLEPDDFKVEWVDASSFRSSPSKASELNGRTLRAQVSEGEPIYETSLYTKTLVSRGDRVKVEVVTPGLVLSTFGIAQEPGGKGQIIRVLQIDSKKEMSGTIKEDHSVEVRL